MSKSFITGLEQKISATPHKKLLTFEGEEYSFVRFGSGVEDFVQYLISYHQIDKGSRVAIMAENSVENAMLIYALAKIGAIWIPINAEQRGKSLRYIFEDSLPDLVIADEQLIALIINLGQTHISPISLSALVDNTQSSGVGQQHKHTWQCPDASDPLAIMYTSGTTGPPKGVPVTHAMMRYAMEGVKELTSLKAGDVFFQWEPFYHIAGAQMLFLPTLTNIDIYIVKKFSASRFWPQVSASKATHIHYLGGVLSILLKRPESEYSPCEQLRIAWGGGCSKSTWQEVEDRFNLEVRECYGMTEASSLTTVNVSGPVGSVGRSLPWIHVGIKDESGGEAPPGVAGEIVITQREDGVLFGGYLNKEIETDKVINNNSFMTGDRGWLDQSNYLYFTGRLNDSVRHKGENVSSWEVESTIMDHPQVESAAMVGVATEIGEQDIHLYVQKKANSKVSEKELHEWMKSRLARYQLPRYITFIEGFPRTPSQRIKKKLLTSENRVVWQSH